MKQWMASLLAAGVEPSLIVYLTGELIDDHHALVRALMELLSQNRDAGIFYILLDEVTYIRDWDRGVKYLADAGLFQKVVLLLTGSDSVIIREARMRFPGRRGTSGQVDFHLFPLSFYEYIELKRVMTPDQLQEALQSSTNQEFRRILLEPFEAYLLHGGYLTAINDLEESGRIMPSTFAVYCDWIRGDMLKRGKQEKYLREVLGAVIKRYGSQITWNNLAQELSIDHPATVSDYLEKLASAGGRPF